MAVLEIENVTKTYKTKGRVITAAKNVTFHINAGEIVGFIGQNGAGKSTTIKIATGLAEATSGNVRINGYDVKTDRVKALKKVGCIVETPDLYKEWSAMKNLEYFASLSRGKGFDTEGKPFKEAVIARSEELLKMVGLWDRRNDQVRRYSLGMKQRAGIAQALLCKPDLLILDEPTNGLDPNGIKEVRDILHKLSHEYGLAVLVSSHLLSEVQQMCDRYVIIDKGEIVGEYTQADLENGNRTNEVILTTDDTVKARDVLLNELGITSEQVAEGKVRFSTEKSVSDVAKELILAGVSVLGIAKKEMTLEELFMNVTEREDNK